MQLINYIKWQKSIAEQSDERTSLRYTMQIRPDTHVLSPFKPIIWSGRWIALLGDLKAVEDTPEGALSHLLGIIESMPEPGLEGWEKEAYPLKEEG